VKIARSSTYSQYPANSCRATTRAAIGSHYGAVSGADPQANGELYRRNVEASERLDEPEAGFLIVSEDVTGNSAAAWRRQPYRLRLGDQIADRQDEAVFADQYAAAGAFGAERAGRKSVFWNGRTQPENRAQRLV
jgi:hypothetical protein